MQPTKTHLHYIDALRVFAFLLVIPFHTAILYSTFGWEVKAVEQLPWLDWPILWFHQWRLPLLFMVSGMGVAIALQRKTFAAFISERTKRLVIPFLVALPLVVMPHLFTSFLYQGYIEGGAPYLFFGDWLRQLWHNGNLYHLWFVEYLMVITAVFSPFLWWLNGFKLGAIPALFQLLGWVLLLISLIGWELYLRPLYPETNDLITDWANISLFAHFFLAGFLIMKQPHLLGYFAAFKWVFLIVGMALLVIEVLTYSEVSQIPYWELLTVEAAICIRLMGIIGLVLGLLGIAFQYFSAPNKWVTYLNGSLYPVYIFHQTIIVVLGYEVAKGHWSAGVQFVTVVLGTVLFCYVLYEGLLKRITWLGFLFGLKPNTNKNMGKPISWILTGTALVMWLGLYLLPRNIDRSFTKPVIISEEYAGNVPVTITAKKVGNELMVPLLISEFAGGAYIPLSKQANGGYAVTLNLKQGSYKYQLLIDNIYQPDPKNRLIVIDEKGTKKSILRVEK
jgi:surface polysaccharide O-acyltransferase-like enzyme